MKLNADLLDLMKSFGSNGTIIIDDNEYVNLGVTVQKPVKSALLEILDTLGYWKVDDSNVIIFNQKKNKIKYSPLGNLELELNLERDFLEIRFEGETLDTSIQDLYKKEEAAVIRNNSEGEYKLVGASAYFTVLIEFVGYVNSLLKEKGYGFFTPIDVVKISRRADRKDFVVFTEKDNFNYLGLLIGKVGLFGR